MDKLHKPRCPLCRDPNQTPQDILTRLRRHAENDVPEAVKALGDHYRLGSAGLEKAEVEAARLYERAVELDCVEAMGILGSYYEDKVGGEMNKKKAEQLYRRAADRGCPNAQRNLGRLVFYAGDFGEAACLFGLAAAQDHALAQYDLGVCHHSGKGVPENTEEAKRLWRLAAAKGRAEAQYSLGRLALDEEDFGEAVRLYGLAAAQGHPNAQFSLGKCHWSGIGVPENTEEAVRLLGLAAAQGHSKAQRAMEFLERELGAAP